MSSTKTDSRVLYRHTQRSPLFFFLILLSGAMILLAGTTGQPTEAIIVLSIVSVIFGFLAFSFYSLTSILTADHLRIRFGPIPLFGAVLKLDEIEDVQQDTSSIIDGWGIHYVPLRGWTLNLWGFDCVRIRKGNRVIRIGSDDAENLANQIRTALRDRGREM